MDSLSDFFPLLIAAVYLLLKLRRAPRRTAATPPAPNRAPARSTAGATPFEQLLARLEEASPTVVPEPKREFSRPESSMVVEDRAAAAAYEARAAQATAFRSLEAPPTARGFEAETRGFEHPRTDADHDRHGFGDANPLSEPAFSRAADADRRPADPNRMAYDPHGLAPAPAAPPAARLLASPEALREAFVLSTILGRRPPLRRARRATA